MGVDTAVVLPAAVQVDDVAKACAILLGRPKKWYDLESKQHTEVPTKSGWVEVEGISFETSKGQPSCCTINIEEIPDGWWFFYHFEWTGGYRGMMGRSRGERIALHKRLVDLFGGKVDYQDCDSKSVDYRRKSPAWLGKCDSNRQFHALQMALWNLSPMTDKEVQAARKYSAYDPIEAAA